MPSEIMVRACEMFIRLHPDDTLPTLFPGCWELSGRAFGADWRVAINGHGEPRLESSGTNVEPFGFSVWRNGWPVAIGNVHGGGIASSSLDPDGGRRMQHEIASLFVDGLLRETPPAREIRDDV